MASIFFVLKTPSPYECPNQDKDYTSRNNHHVYWTKNSLIEPKSKIRLKSFSPRAISSAQPPNNDPEKSSRGGISHEIGISLQAYSQISYN